MQWTYISENLGRVWYLLTLTLTADGRRQTLTADFDGRLRTAGVVVKTVIAPAKHVLGQQPIADVHQFRAYSVGLMHYMCQLC